MIAIQANLNFFGTILFIVALLQKETVKSDNPQTSTNNTRVVPKVESITLSPISMPYRVDETHLLNMDLSKRRELCDRMHSEIRDPIPKDKNYSYFVPGTHMFNFDGEDWLSVYCPTIPAFFIFHELVSNTEMWYTRTLKPSIDHYKFNFEIAGDVSEDFGKKIEIPVLPENDLYTIEKEQRWYLCKKARQLIRYKSAWDSGVRVGHPKPHKFTFFSGHKEVYHAFSCSTEPSIFLHTSHSGPSNVLTITLLGDSRQLEKNERPWKPTKKRTIKDLSTL